MKKKRWILCAAALALTGCSPKEPMPEASKTVESVGSVSPEETGALTDGTYHASATGHQGPVEVSVTLADGKIDRVTIDSSFESQGVQKVLHVVPERIVEAQSYNVDTVAGATFAGRAVKEAVKKALVEAGAGESDFSKEVHFPSSEVDVKEADVIVIGGGGAGLSAAVSAHESGASVLVLEKLGFAGGSTIFSGGALNAADDVRAKTLTMSDVNRETVEKNLSREPKDDYEAELQKKVREQWEAFQTEGGVGMFDSPEFHALQTYNGGDYLGRPELIDVLTQKAPQAVQWAIDHGAQVDDQLGMATGALWMRSHYGKKDVPNGSYLIYALEDYIANHDSIDIQYNAPVKELIQTDGRVTGVKAEINEKEVTFRAKRSVILATGGFGANVEMRQKYNEQWADLGPQIGCSNQRPAAQGDGILLGESIGAELIDMGLIQLHPNGQPGTGMMMGQPHTSGLNRIFVNKDGKRFVSEDSRRDVLVNAIYDQPDGFMWIVADGNRYPEGDALIENDVVTGKTFKAQTLEELAQMIDVPYEALRASIDEYNATVDGAPDPFGLVNYDKKLGVAPFYAAKRLPTVHHTMGGIHIDTTGQVLDAKGQPVKGLFAAGEVTGGIHGGNRLGGNAITDIVVFGMEAGRSAAQAE